MNAWEFPVQPFAVAATLIVAVTGVLPVFIAVNGAIFPEPLAASPIEVVLFVQLKLEPETKLLNVMAEVWDPLQTNLEEGSSTSGNGFTVTVTLMGAPGHPLAVGTTL